MAAIDQYIERIADENLDVTGVHFIPCHTENIFARTECKI